MILWRVNHIHFIAIIGTHVLHIWIHCKQYIRYIACSLKFYAKTTINLVVLSTFSKLCKHEGFFFSLLKASKVTFHTNQSAHEKSGFMGHPHRKTKLHFVWPCGILTKWPWKEYEESVWGEDHECRRKLFLLIFIGSRVHNTRTKFTKSVVNLALRQALLELREFGSHILLIINFYILFLISKW